MKVKLLIYSSYYKIEIILNSNKKSVGLKHYYFE